MSDSVEGLKQRLVGAFVILTLAVIFLPMIFDKPHVIGNSKIVPIPPKPDFQSVTITKPEKPKYEVLKVDPADRKVKPANKIASESKNNVRKPVPAASKTDDVSKAVSRKESDTVKSPEINSKPSSKSNSSVSQLPAFNNVWMVQLGTFSDKNNAYRLRDRLRKDGFDAHTKPISIKGKASVRVFSGPYVNKREAQKLKKKLDAKYRVKSLVVFFDA